MDWIIKVIKGKMMSRDSVNGNEPKKKDKEVLNSRINRADKVCATDRVSGDSQMNRMGTRTSGIVEEEYISEKHCELYFGRLTL